MGMLERLTGSTYPATPKGASEPPAGPTGAAAPPAGGTVAPALTSAPSAPPSAAAPVAERPRMFIDITESEALGFINKLTIALGHSYRYGQGETFAISSQFRSTGNAPVSGAICFRLYKDGHLPP